MRAIEMGGSVGSSLVAATVAPEFMYYASGGQVDIRGILPLRLLFAAGGGVVGGVVGHIVVSFLDKIINAHHQGVGANAVEVTRDAGEEISSEVWRSLKLPPSLNKQGEDVVDTSEDIPPWVLPSLKLPPEYKPDGPDE